MESGIMLTGQGIEVFRLMTMKSAMKLEVLHGIKATSRAKGNPFKIAKLEYGVQGRTNKEVYENFCKLLESFGM
jgi:hypothetical protein